MTSTMGNKQSTASPNTNANRDNDGQQATEATETTNDASPGSNNDSAARDFATSWQIACSVNQSRYISSWSHLLDGNVDDKASKLTVGYCRRVSKTVHEKLIMPKEIATLCAMYYFVPSGWAKPSDWSELKPFPNKDDGSKNKVELSCDFQYSKEQILMIRHGSIPQQMEDKWFIFEDEAGNLNIHRSWTGIKVYQCSLRGLKYDTNDDNKQDVTLCIDKIFSNGEWESFFGYTPTGLFALLMNWVLRAGKPINMSDEEWEKLNKGI